MVQTDTFLWEIKTVGLNFVFILTIKGVSDPPQLVMIIACPKAVQY